MHVRGWGVEFSWSVCLSVCVLGLYLLPGAWTDRAETWWDDQGHAGERHKKGIFFDPLMLTGVRLVGHRCLFQAVEMTKRPRIWHDGTSGLKMANDKVSQPQKGDQGQVG